MTKTKFNRRKAFLFYLIGFTFLLALIFSLGEIIIRIAQKSEHQEDKPPPYNVAEMDDKYGWKMKENYHWEGEMKTDSGLLYSVNLVSVENGFKEFGNVDSPRKKVFFIGDSYTQSVEVSNDKTFYNILADSLDFELFAYGQAGFGTLQEYFILEEFLGLIQPDLVILQTCSNDFIDNHHSLEIACGYNIGLRRPYLNEAGDIHYLKGNRSSKSWLNKSEFWTFLAEKWENIQIEYLDNKEALGEHQIATNGLKYQPYKTSIEITYELLKRMCHLVNSKSEDKLIVFTADGFQPQKEQMNILCDSLNLRFLPKPILYLDSLKWIGESVHSLDKYHWNEKGHQVVANALLPELKAILNKD